MLGLDVGLYTEDLKGERGIDEGVEMEKWKVNVEWKQNSENLSCDSLFKMGHHFLDLFFEEIQIGITAI